MGTFEKQYVRMSRLVRIVQNQNQENMTHSVGQSLILPHVLCLDFVSDAFQLTRPSPRSPSFVELNDFSAPFMMPDDVSDLMGARCRVSCTRLFEGA